MAIMMIRLWEKDLRGQLKIISVKNTVQHMTPGESTKSRPEYTSPRLGYKDLIFRRRRPGESKYDQKIREHFQEEVNDSTETALINHLTVREKIKRAKKENQYNLPRLTYQGQLTSEVVDIRPEIYSKITFYKIQNGRR